jgi:CheY-like chemotaxis protein
MTMAPLSIICVDDDPADRQAVRDHVERRLRRNPFVYLSRAEELLERLADGQIVNPGIILVDLVLPGMSGYQLVQTLRREHKYLDHAAILIVTGADDQESIETAREVGADAYLPKPVSLLSFMDAIQRMDHYDLELRDRRLDTMTT